MTRVLVAACHPDDEVLGVGGTVLRHRAAGDEVRLTTWFPCRIDPAPGVERHLLGLDHPENIVQDWQPEIVYTHHDGDINADHRALSEAVLVACRPYAAPSVKSIRMFETPSSSEWGARPFVPNLFVDISEYVHRKVDAMRESYASEMRDWPHPRSEKALLDRAGYWGQQVGMRYAEPFRVVRERW